MERSVKRWGLLAELLDEVESLLIVATLKMRLNKRKWQETLVGESVLEAGGRGASSCDLSVKSAKVLS